MQHFKVSSSKILGYNVMHLKWEIPWISGVFYVLLSHLIPMDIPIAGWNPPLLAAISRTVLVRAPDTMRVIASAQHLGITMDKAERVRHDNIIPHDSHMDTVGETNGYIIIHTLFPSNRSLRYMAHVCTCAIQSLTSSKTLSRNLRVKVVMRPNHP